MAVVHLNLHTSCLLSCLVASHKDVPHPFGESGYVEHDAVLLAESSCEMFLSFSFNVWM